jgi:DNA-directed RNA polymerase specialized sigma24 family protein
VARACDGDEGAWRELVEHVWPTWRELVRHHRALGPLASSEDHVHNVMLELVEKLGPEGGTALGLYPAWRERSPGKTFEDWLRIVTTYTVRDYVRLTLGRSRRREPGLPSSKRLLNEFVTSPAIDHGGSVSPTMTLAQTARELLAFASSRLTPEQYLALTSWIQGADFDEIAEEIGADVEDAKRLVRASIAVLRRHFAALKS